MFCPACGSSIKDEQKFCRTCGMNLQQITPQVAQHLQHNPPSNSKLRAALNKVEYLGLALGGSGAALIVGTSIFALLALAFIGPEAKSMSPMWSKLFGIGLLLLLKGTFLFALPWITKEFFPPNKSATTLTDFAKTKELPAQPFAAAQGSITEQTTRNLEPVVRSRQRE
ncbi:MAG: zinc ribbon domain-containing protein [Acidobacteria bacterium]|nr:zinc ribbon domain-containing protein [Acidobacteriota bacterium]